MKHIVALVVAASSFFLSHQVISSTTIVNGAGASFPYPIYSKWFSVYEKTNQDVQFNYQAIGSGGGIRQLIKQSIDFGATDAPMRSTDLKLSKHPIQHIPTVIGALTISYNLPSIEVLKLDGDTIAAIFMAEITNWNDKRIKKLNPDLNLPNLEITIVRRSDSSGSTYILSDFLNASSAKWRKKMKVSKTLRWAKDTVETKGNVGVTRIIKEKKGSIGYIELAFAFKNDLKTAKIKNKAGNFVSPTIQTISASARNIGENKDEPLTRSIVFAAGENAYPISAFTYLIVPQKKKASPQSKELTKFLKWALSKGQQLAPQLHYAPLPANLSKRLKAQLD